MSIVLQLSSSLLFGKGYGLSNTLFWCSICRVHWRVVIGRGTYEEGDADVLEEEGPIAMPIEMDP